MITFQTEREIAESTYPSTSSVGIDLGVARFATLSDGTFLEPLSGFKKLEKKLAREQRRLAVQGAASEHKPDLPGLWPHCKREPQDTSCVQVRRMRF